MPHKQWILLTTIGHVHMSAAQKSCPFSCWFDLQPSSPYSSFDKSVVLRLLTTSVQSQPSKGEWCDLAIWWLVRAINSRGFVHVSQYFTICPCHYGLPSFSRVLASLPSSNLPCIFRWLILISSFQQDPNKILMMTSFFFFLNLYYLIYMDRSLIFTR